jgi:hypothetical protein
MNDPDVIMPIDSHARDSADNPPMWQRLGPERIYAERRYLAGHECRLLREGKSRERQNGAGK